MRIFSIWKKSFSTLLLIYSYPIITVWSNMSQSLGNYLCSISKLVHASVYRILLCLLWCTPECTEYCSVHSGARMSVQNITLFTLVHVWVYRILLCSLWYTPECTEYYSVHSGARQSVQNILCSLWCTLCMQCSTWKFNSINMIEVNNYILLLETKRMII